MRIVHVSGHEFLARTIERCFESMGHECHSVIDARQVFDVVRKVEPDIVISGYETFPANAAMLARQVGAEFPEAGVVLFTMTQDPFAIRASLEAGALGYVSKACRFAELAGVVERIGGGDRVLSPSYAQALLRSIDRSDRELDGEDEWLLRQVGAGIPTSDIALEGVGDGPRTRLGRVLRTLDGAGLLGAALAGVSAGFIDLSPVAWPGGSTPLPPVGWRWALALRSVAAGMSQTERLLRGITPQRDAFEMGGVLGMSDTDVVNRLDRAAQLLAQRELPVEFLVNEPIEALKITAR